MKIALGQCRIMRSGSDICNDDVLAHFVECIAVGSGGREKWKNLPLSGRHELGKAQPLFLGPHRGEWQSGDRSWHTAGSR